MPSSSIGGVGRTPAPGVRIRILPAAAAGIALPPHPQHLLNTTIRTIDQHDLPSTQHFLFS